MIPQLIHQTWKTKHIPQKFKSFHDRLLSMHPDWDYHLWTDEENLHFVAENFPEHLQMYQAFPKPIMRADCIRYMLMYQFGGLYLDLDYEMIRPFALNQFTLVLPYNRQKKFGDHYDGFGNCIFASTPGHPFWKFLLEELKGIKDHSEYSRTISLEGYIPGKMTFEESVTGPGLVTKCAFSYNNFCPTDHFPERDEFHPPIPHTRSEYDGIRNKGKAYGIHHCEGSWRRFWFFRRFKRYVRGTVG